MIVFQDFGENLERTRRELKPKDTVLINLNSIKAVLK